MALAQPGIDWRGWRGGISPHYCHNCHSSNVLKIGMINDDKLYRSLLETHSDDFDAPQAFHEQGGELVCGAIVSVRRGLAAQVADDVEVMFERRLETHTLG